MADQAEVAPIDLGLLPRSGLETQRRLSLPCFPEWLDKRADLRVLARVALSTDLAV